MGWLLLPLLLVLSWIFALGVRLRNLRYDRRKPYGNGMKVISVGNLGVGGTGKTPFCLAMLNQLEGKVAVLLRGYHLNEDGMSDEAELYARAVGRTRVFVGGDRCASLDEASKQGFEIALLDDAFQHRRVARDVDLVVLDLTRPPWEDHLLPLGLLRETTTSLARAHGVLLSRCERVSPEQEASARQRLSQEHPHLGVFSGRAGNGRVTRGKVLMEGPGPYFLVSAIGHPENFLASVKDSGLEVSGFHWFPDHHEFSTFEVQEMEIQARSVGAEILMTAKDAVKWPGKMCVFEMDLEIEASFWTWTQERGFDVR